MAAKPKAAPDPRAEFRSKAAQTVEQMRLQHERDQFEARVEAQRLQMEQRFREQQNQSKGAAQLQKLQMDARAKMEAQRQAAQQAQAGEQQPPSMDLGFSPINPSNPGAAVNPTPFAGMSGAEMGGPPVTNMGQPGGPQPGSPQAQQAQQGGGGLAPYLMQATMRQGSRNEEVMPGVRYPVQSSETTTRIAPNVLSAADAGDLAIKQQYYQQRLAGIGTNTRDKTLQQVTLAILKETNDPRIALRVGQAIANNDVPAAEAALAELGPTISYQKAKAQMDNAVGQLGLARDRNTEVARHNQALEGQGQTRIEQTGKHQSVMEQQGEKRLTLDQQRLDASVAADKAKQTAEEAKRTAEQAKVRDADLALYAPILGNPSTTPEQRAATEAKLAAQYGQEGVDRAKLMADSLNSKAHGKALASADIADFKANIKEAHTAATSSANALRAVDELRNSGYDQYAGRYANYEAMVKDVLSQTPGLNRLGDQEARAKWLENRRKFTAAAAALSGPIFTEMFPGGRAITTEAKLLQGKLVDPTTNPAEVKGAIDYFLKRATLNAVRSNLWLSDRSKMSKSFNDITDQEATQALTDAIREAHKQGGDVGAAYQAVEKQFNLLPDSLAHIDF